MGPNNVAANLAYALQTTDLFNYFINRFDIGLSVGRIFYKLAIVNAFSIIEGIIYSFIDNIHEQCKNIKGKVCKFNTKCNFYFKKAKNYNFSEILDELEKNSFLYLEKKKNNWWHSWKNWEIIFIFGMLERMSLKAIYIILKPTIWLSKFFITLKQNFLKM